MFVVCGLQLAAASAAALFEVSSTTAFCLASASAAKCIRVAVKKVIIATISANKLQCWWCVGYNLLLPQLQPSSKLPLQQPFSFVLLPFSLLLL
jgi:hypothetical protein